MKRSLLPIALVAVLALAAPVAADLPADEHDPAKLDVMFIGAHPDDEASRLSTYGQWWEHHDVRTGVITITRGEGGGNAIGPEEGSALGLIREAEERRGVAYAGIERVYNLDYVDFWYNLSAPLTEEVWQRDAPDDLLERVVRILRMTRPEVIVTMSPGINHGHHQKAAWVAVDAYEAAADPEMFPEMLAEEGLEPWRVSKIFTTRAQGSGPTGPACEGGFVPAEPTDTVQGVWGGRASDVHDTTWAQVERWGQREHASQGWAGFPDVSDDPAELGCDYQTLIDSRVPWTEGNAEPTAMLEGAVLPAQGGLPLGTELYLTTDTFRVGAGEPLEVTAHAANGGDSALDAASVVLSLPEGWTGDTTLDLGTLAPGEHRTATATITLPASADPGRVALTAVLSAGDATGTTKEVVEVVPAVLGNVELHPDVERFREWTREAGVEQVDSLIKAQVAIAQGETRPVRIDLTNTTAQTHAGEVAIVLPEGFTTDTARQGYELAAGAQGSVTFEVTHTDLSMPTANEGGADGEHDFTVTTTSDAGQFTEVGALNLVPATTIPEVEDAPDLDGTADAGEYPGETLDLSRRWEGQAPESPEDASGSAHVSWHDDALYLHVEVTDDVLGAVVDPDDAKRHWRTDSVEITIDPRGDSRDTSTTFKAGVFPLTDDPDAGNPPGGSRDADNHQGPLEETAPGVELAAQVSEPYTGYTLEVMIPMAELPAAVDPDRMGLNILIYDSDTQDLSGQTRLGWSTFGGVQASPYRWGRAVLEGYSPPPDRSVEPDTPIIPDDVTRSVESPQSIRQSAIDGVPLAGGPPTPEGRRPRIAGTPVLGADRLTVVLEGDGEGTAHVFAWDGEEVVAAEAVDLVAGERTTVVLPLDAAARAALEDGEVLVGYEDAEGGTTALAAAIGSADAVAVERYAGTQRYDTARLIAGATFEAADAVVLAKAEDWPDALAGSYVAGLLDSPILLVSRTAAQAETLAALDDLGASEVVLLGGERAVGASTVAQLEGEGYAVTRIAGATRYETAAAVALHGADQDPDGDGVGEWDGDRTAILATGQEFADALVTGSAAWSHRFPLLLTSAGSLHPAAEAALDELAVDRVVIPGGTGAVSAAVAEAVEAKGIAVTRIAGAGRWETAIAFADFAVDELGYGRQHVDVATGFAFADALAMAPKAGAERSPLVLTPGTRPAPTPTLDAWLRAGACDTVSLAIAGGTGAVSEANEAAMAAAASACGDPDDDR